MSRPAIVLLLFLAACRQEPQEPAAVERIDIDAPVEREPRPNGGLPDAEGAAWIADGQNLAFANPAGEPLLTLACEEPPNGPPRLRIVQHAPAPPGAKALFALAGNGIVARVPMDARQDGERWRWEGRAPADWYKLDVFIGDASVAATMPGGGEVELAASPLPGEFVTACRARGEPPEPEASESPSPA